jgi:hypothetical protein
MEALLKKFIEENPQLLTKPAGRPKGSENKPKEIEVTKEEMANVTLNSKQIKEIAKSKRQPRKQQTEEERAKMLENLARGREKAKENRELKKSLPIDIPKPVVKETFTVVVPKIKHRQKKVVVEDTDTEPFTESESTDVETKKIRKRIDRRIAIIEKIDNKINEPVKPVNPFDRLFR